MNIPAKTHPAKRVSTALTVLFSMLAVVLPYLAFAADPDNAPCNLKSPWVNDALYAGLTAAGGTGGLVCVNASGNAANLIDADLTNFANVNITGLGCSTTFRVKDNDAADTYPAGYFAGFKIASANLLSGSIGAAVTVETWNNNALVESRNIVTSLVGLDSSLIDGAGNATVGFVTASPFDEVRIRYTTLVGVLFTGEVFHAVIEKFCSGANLECNTQTAMNNPAYPTIIDSANTGFGGVACVGCQLNNAENLLSANTTDYADLHLTTAVLATGSVAVQDVLTDYPAGGFAGFNISNPNLLDADVLTQITLRTYRNGSPTGDVATVGLGNLVVASSSLLNGTGDQLVGFVTTQPFDEIKLEIASVVGVDLGEFRIYNAVFQTFCPGAPLSCSANTYLTNPAYPAIIDIEKTGIGGAVCALCSVTDTGNLIDADTSNYATIDLTANVLATGSVAVQDVLTDYPLGTFAGFDVESPALLDLSLLNGAALRTYLNGTPQETVSGGNLLVLRLFNTTRGIIGFTTSMPFDEIQLTLGGVVDVNVGEAHVYGAVLQGGSNAGTVPPTIPIIPPNTVATTTNACPLATVNLNSSVTSSTPPGAELVWYTTLDHTGAPVANPTAVSASGTYYAFYRDTVTGCFSTGVALVVTVNPCPDAVDDSFITPAGTPLNGNVASNDTIPPGSIFSKATDPAHGSVTVNPDGSFTYTAAAGYAGPDSFTYQLCSPGGCDTATVSLTVGPDAVNDSFTTPAGTPLNGNVAANDTYEAGSTFAIATQPSHGTLTLNPNGTFTYTPAAGYAGPDSFTYQICSPGGSPCDTATVSLTVGPDAANDNFTVQAGGTLSNTVASNDTVASGSTFTVSTGPGHGTLTLNPNGTFTYTPAAGYAGPDSFTYQVCSPGGSPCDTATVSLTVGPNAVDDTVTTPSGTPLNGNVATNDVVEPGSTFSVVSNPTNGTVTVNADGTFTYTPTPGFAGQDSFTYQVCAPGGSPCDTATVTVNVTGPGVPPQANSDSVTTPYGTAITVPVLANDTGGKTSGGTATSLVPTTVDLDPSTPGVQASKAITGEGTFAANPDGTVGFTPATGFNGTVSASYTVTDDAGNPSNTALITVVVQAPADAGNAVPPVANPDFATTTGTTPVTIPVLANDTGGKTSGGTATTLPEAAPTVDLDPNTAGVQNSFAVAGGTFTVNSDGTVGFTADVGFSGTASTPYVAIDDAGQTSQPATITVVVGGSSLVAVNDQAQTPVNTPVTVPILNNDLPSSGADLDPSQLDLDPAAAGIQNSLAIPGQGTFTANANGTVSFAPETGFVGTVTLPYAITDSLNATGTATLTLEVTPITVTAVNDTVSTAFGAPVTLNPAANDSTQAPAVLNPSTVDLDPATPGIQTHLTTPDGTWSVTDVFGTVQFTPGGGFTGATSIAYAVSDSLGNVGTATITVSVGPDAVDDTVTTPANTPLNGNVAGNDTVPPGSTFSVDTAPTHGTLTLNPDGTFTYTPAADYLGPDSFTYQVCAPGGSPCDAATVNITVGPNAVDDSFTTPANTPLGGGVSANDVFAPGSTFSRASDPAHGAVTVNPDGAFTYTPAADYLGPDSFTYQVCAPPPDGTVCDIATVNLTVGPNAVDDTVTTPAGTPVNGNVSTNDIFAPGSTFTVPSGGEPVHGALNFNPDGTFTYTPDEGYVGSDSFPYEVCALGGSPCDTAVVNLTVGPNAVNDAITTPAGTPVSDDVSSNDIFAPGSTFGVATGPSHGALTFNPDGTFTYTPDAGYVGSDSFIYQVCSPGGSPCDTATVSLTVGPNAVDDNFTIQTGTPLNGDVSTNDTVPANSTFTVPGGNGPSHGALTFNPDGTFTYTPDAGYVGSDSFIYQVCSPGGSPCDTATASITVTAQAAQLTVHKTASTGEPSVGLPFTYTLTVTNTGGPAANPLITDYLPAGIKLTAVSGGSGWSCLPSSPLPMDGGPGATLTCAKASMVAGTETIVLTVVPTATTGNPTNFATIQGDGDTPPATPDTGNCTEAQNCSYTEVTPRNPRLDLVKKVALTGDVNGDGQAQAGDTLTYTFTLSNNGDVPLTNVTVTDPKLGAGTLSCGPTTSLGAAFALGGTLQAGDSVICTGTHTVTAAEAGEGQIGNTSAGTGLAPDGKPTQSTASSTFENTPTGTGNSQVSITKMAVHHDANGNGVFDENETVTYGFLVRNTGTVVLSNIEVTDIPALAIDCGGTNTIASLAAGTEVICTAPDYVLTAADAANGFVTDTATAAGSDPGSNPVTDSDTLVLNSGQPAGLSLAKSAVLSTDTGIAGLSEGDTLTYTVVATNTGAVPLTNVTASDNLLGVALSCTPAQGATLNPGARMVCTGTHVVQTGAANPVDNQASATGIPEGRQQPVYASANLVVPYQAATSPNLYTLSSQIWRDSNDNGVLEGGEPGIDGVVIRLLSCDTSGNNCVQAKQADGVTPVPDQTTAAGGTYQFANVPENAANQSYRLSVLPSNFTSDGNGTKPLYGSLSSYVDDAAAFPFTPNRDEGIGTTPTATDGILSRSFSLMGQSNGATFANLNFGFAKKAVATAPDLMLTKQASVATVNPGGTLTYTLQASNKVGAGDLKTRPTILDTLPAGMTATLPITASGWNCSASTVQQVKCSYTGGLPLSGGASLGAAIVIPVTAPASPGGVNNTATITKLPGEVSYTDNSATATVTVGP